MSHPPPPDPAGHPPRPGYPAPGPPAPAYPPSPYAFRPPTNTLAILALVFAFVFAPAAIVLGHLARRQIRQTGEEGDGMALAGLIVGYVFTGLTVLFCLGYGVFLVAILGMAGASGSG